MCMCVKEQAKSCRIALHTWKWMRRDPPKAFAPNTFCTKHLWTINYTEYIKIPFANNLYTKRVWRQRRFTPNTFHTKQLLHQITFTRETFYTRSKCSGPVRNLPSPQFWASSTHESWEGSSAINKSNTFYNIFERPASTKRGEGLSASLVICILPQSWASDMRKTTSANSTTPLAAPRLNRGMILRHL